jgi:hypothetical protein
VSDDLRYICPECGPIAKVDEDGCCVSCGREPFRTDIYWFRREIAAAVRRARGKTVGLVRVDRHMDGGWMLRAYRIPSLATEPEDVSGGGDLARVVLEPQKKRGAKR